MYQALYPDGHPYRNLTIGLIDDLEHASADDVKNFFKTWYVPSNATIAISGDFDLATGKKLVDKWFGSLPTSKKPVVVRVPAPTTAATELTVTDDFAKLRQITFAWHSPAKYAAGDAELDILADALGAEGTGRLYKALVYDKPIATQVRVDQGGSQFSGIFQISVTLRSDAKVEDARKIVLDEVAKLTKEPLADREINRVIAGNEAQVVYALESVFGRAQRLQEYNHFLGDPDKLTWDLDRYRKTNAANITAVVARYLQPEHMVTVITEPAARAPKGASREPPRSSRSSRAVRDARRVRRQQARHHATGAAGRRSSTRTDADADAAATSAGDARDPDCNAARARVSRRGIPRASAAGPAIRGRFRLPKVQSCALKNGVQVYLVEQHVLPIVSMDLNFDGGDLADPKGKEGLSRRCACRCSPRAPRSSTSSRTRRRSPMSRRA